MATVTLCRAARLTRSAQRALAAGGTAPVSADMIKFRSVVMNSGSAKLNRYGGRHSVTALPGDGIGPEMLQHVQKIFGYAQVNIPLKYLFDFEEVNVSSMPESTDDLSQALTAIKRNGVALKGNIESKFDDPMFKSRNVELRRELDLFANVLHCCSIPSIRSRHRDIDMIIIRENTEGEYSGLEHETTPGIVESLKIVTQKKIERISRFAFQYAKKYGRKKITAVHKANIQKLGDGLFLRVCQEIAEKEYPEIKFDSMIVDNASMQLVARPQQFDIMLMPNLYGNIISNIACGLVGGPGLVSGINVGDMYAVFETGTRNTGRELVGKDVANPTAFIRAAADMLRYLGLNQHADLISDSLYRTLVERRLHTPDIGGTAKTSEVVESVLDFIGQEISLR